MKAFVLLIAFFLSAEILFAQNDNTLDEQTIVIYNEYSPVLKDASRIESLPVILDTVKVEPKFSYEVMPSMYRTTFEPSKIPAATVKGEALKPLNTGMVKIGYGNYISPFFEGYVNSKRQKNYSLGIAAKHHSSFGKIKNVLNQKIYSGYDDSRIEAYGKRILFKSVLSGKVFFSSNGINYYGYDPAVYGNTDTINWDVFNYADTKDEIEKQRYNRVGANIRLESEQTGLKHWNYLLDGNYQYFFTKSKDSQHKADITANIGRTVKKAGYGLDINFVFNGNSWKAPTNSLLVLSVNPSYNEIILSTKPYFTFNSEKWKIRAGVNACGKLLDGVKYYFYPDVFVQLNISNTLLPYIKYSGHLDSNNLEFVSGTNPFVNNFANFGYTNYQHDANIGIKANISKKIYLHINANYSHVNDMMFFVNDTDSKLRNKFTMEYTNADLVGAYAELALKDIAPRLDITLKGHYYYFIKLANGEKPWQKPSYDVALKTSYRLTNSISFGLEGYLLGSSYAKVYNSINYTEKKIPIAVDINLFGEYKIDDNFNVFLYLNNIACQRYYIWNNYRAQGFNAMIGLTYLF